MKSLLNKASDIKYTSAKQLTGKTEKDIVLSLLELSNILDKSIESKSLNDIAEFLYIITSLYNKFYAENRILTEDNKELQESWLVLTNVVYKVNMLLLDILGIKVPEKM